MAEVTEIEVEGVERPVKEGQKTSVKKWGKAVMDLGFCVNSLWRTRRARRPNPRFRNKVAQTARKRRSALHGKAWLPYCI